MTKSITTFSVISSDPNSYKLSIEAPHNSDYFQVMTDAIQYRMTELIDKNSLTLIGLSTKIDMFEIECGHENCFIEIDTLHVSAQSIAFETYFYVGRHLKGKGSCSLFFKPTTFSIAE
ncbi:hypothetical protein [Pseudochryseolinea flava]|uniref:Uncharacterized protein n=1 Tax=Pseudochryseolinea flava TaxID=2059302 RepID=A0A364XVM9_9BACT|nr:hypothetical protein [Pseudochryseolinea flava]RAV98158.1 hypothetical protein DQQ10_25160 [Pseudochryseolinea flava]